jgi:hypothetical protein
MHTGIISFADRIVHNIKTSDTKDIILDQLYSLYNIKIIQKHYHKLDENNIQYVTKNPHLCNLRSNGNPYYMYFSLYNDIPIIYFIDKKIHPGYQKPRILLVRGLFSESLYKNTLIDGEMIKCNDGKWEFLMNDILVYEGKHLIHKLLPDRLKLLYDLLDTQYTQDSIVDVCTYKVKTYYHLYKESILALIELSNKLNYTCRGIQLWSFNLKYKPKLYNFNEDNIINVVRKTKDETKFMMCVEKEADTNEVIDKQSSDVSDDGSNLWITQTDYPDVYNIYKSENILTSNKLGVVLIPDLSCSKMMRLAFKNKNAASILHVKCNYSNSFAKWYPIKIL